MKCYSVLHLNVNITALLNIKLSWLQKFLLLDEISGDKKTRLNYVDIPCNFLDNLSRTKECLLRHINQNVSKGKLLVLSGPTGCGKSLLLKSLLGELPLGSVDQRLGSASYAGQEAWLYADTIRGNIRFHQPWDEARYARVLEACALLPDLGQLPGNDSSLVGDRGANLSGGQRARVSLARAIYKDADVYLIDDALASVDAPVGKKIMDDCIKGYLKEKVRILVTHNPHHLQDADEVIIMKSDGGVDFQGSYADLIASDHYILGQRPAGPATEDPPPANTAESELELTFAEKEAEQPRRAAEADELAETGSPAWMKYFEAGASDLTMLCLCCSFLVAQASVTGCDYWLAKWLSENQRNEWMEYMYVNNSEMVSSLYFYGGLTLFSIVMWTASSIFFYKVCMNASRNLHSKMFSSLLKTPMRFFQLNSSGRILNRFSKDTGLVDETLPTVTLDAVQSFLMMTAVVIQLTITSISIVPVIIMVFTLGVTITKKYLHDARDFKRNECTEKSRVFSHVQSTIPGLTTIRSAGNQQAISEQFDYLQAAHLFMYFRNTTLSSFYGFFIDMIFIVLLLIVTLYLVFYNKSPDQRTGTEVLIITQTLMLYGKIQFGLRQTSEMLVQMVSVERIFQFIDLKSEGPFEKDNTMLKEWPRKGKIEFKNVYLRYSKDEDPVLKDISLTINPQEKIGIVGRTGGGKSSLIAALLRLAEADGSIFIDDVDVKTLGLHDLRRRISVIPQEPVLFTTTVRNNLDPMQINSDQILWKALKDVELRNRINSLDYSIESGGGNLSSGEKQLLCLARAIIAGNKIVVLDEATANIDSKTAYIIQKTIKKLFCDCTVITIAHNLNTLFESDRILHIEQGEIVEIIQPSTLSQPSKWLSF